MSAKGIRLVANLILWIGVISCLLGCIIALLLANGNPLGMPTEYVPDAVDFFHLSFHLVVVIAVAIILHTIATKKEKRARIRACWEEADKVTDADIEELEAAAALPAPEEITETETVEEEPIAQVTEEPTSRIETIRTKIAQKIPLDEKKLAQAQKAAKIAIPVGIVCATMVIMATKLGAYRREELRRKSFFNWLG